MMKTRLRCYNRVIFLAIVGMVAGCGGDDDSNGGAGGSGGSGGSGGGDSGETKIASATGNWEAYMDPYADGGASPIPSTMKGTVDAFSAGGGKMRVALTVSGLPASRPFGSHIHKLACTDNKAGTHYQHDPAPDGGLSDPKYANAKNEVWLDFVTNATGEGSAESNVDWVPRAGEAKSVVIHDQPTKNDGTAGPKLGCINMAF